MMKNFKVFIYIVLALFIFLGASWYFVFKKNVETSIAQKDVKTIYNAGSKSYPEPFPLHHAEFSTFLNAMNTAGLEDFFKGTGPFTGFIPTNDAFEKLDKRTWEDLQKPENQDKLVAILTYHMITGKYNINHLNRLAPKHLKTINGKSLDITVENKEVMVNNVKIIQADLEGPNWIVHKIDTVLIPR